MFQISESCLTTCQNDGMRLKGCSGSKAHPVHRGNRQVRLVKRKGNVLRFIKGRKGRTSRNIPFRRRIRTISSGWKSILNKKFCTIFRRPRSNWIIYFYFTGTLRDFFYFRPRVRLHKFRSFCFFMEIDKKVQSAWWSWIFSFHFDSV